MRTWLGLTSWHPTKLLMLLPFLTLFSLACGVLPERERSGQLSEKGIVVQSTLQPGQSGSVTTFSTSGHVGFGSANIAEKYTVVFRCEHGVAFAIEDRKDLWERLAERDSVTIYYYDIYDVKDGAHDLVDIEFINAVKLLPTTATVEQ